MSIIGDIVGGIGSLVSGLTSTAPKITPGKGFSTSVSSPFYNFSKGALTATPGAASTAGFNGIMGNLNAAGNTFADMAGNGLSAIKTTLGGFGDSLKGLRESLTPGYGRITEARVKAIKDAAASSVGDLRSQLSQRGVLGSSFGADTESRTKLAFAQAEEQARAQGTIDEIQANVDITKTEIANQAAILGVSEEQRATLQSAVTSYMAQATVLSDKITKELSQFQLAAGLTTQIDQILMGQATSQANLDMLQQTMNAANINYGLTKIGGGIGKAATGGLFGTDVADFASLFGGSGGGSGGGGGKTF